MKTTCWESGMQQEIQRLDSWPSSRLCPKPVARFHQSRLLDARNTQRETPRNILFANIMRCLGMIEKRHWRPNMRLAVSRQAMEVFMHRNSQIGEDHENNK